MLATGLPRDMGVTTQKTSVREMGVQTVGLFFPSSRDLNRFVQHNDAEARAKSDAIGEPKRIFISAVSPGRGYWYDWATNTRILATTKTIV